jgi:hypothetical protein
LGGDGQVANADRPFYNGNDRPLIHRARAFRARQGIGQESERPFEVTTMRALLTVFERPAGRRVRPAFEGLESRLVPAVINVDPSNYLTLVPTAQPGDTVVFAAGSYTSGLDLSGMNGTADAPITFDGAAGAVIQGTRGSNTVELDNTSYLLVENFTVDSRHLNDGIKAGGGLANVSHDIQILGNTILNADSSQQTVGISTKCIAWNWLIEGNTIDGAGTGLYLGDSTGAAPDGMRAVDRQCP